MLWRQFGRYRGFSLRASRSAWSVVCCRRKSRNGGTFVGVGQARKSETIGPVHLLIGRKPPSFNTRPARARDHSITSGVVHEDQTTATESPSGSDGCKLSCGLGASKASSIGYTAFRFKKM